MHIVFVSRELGIYKRTGGIGTYVWDIARKIAHHGHKCTVISSSYDTSMSGDENINGVRVIKLPDDQLNYKNKVMYFLKFKNNFLAYRKRINDCLEKLLQEDKIDIIEYAEYGVESIIWHRRAPRPVPMVIRWHTPIGKQFKLKHILYYPLKKWIDSLVKEALNRTDAISFPSQWMADKVSEKIDISRFHYKIIPNGINFSEWQVENKTIRGKDTKKNINLLFVGTLEARKGFVDLIKAVKILRRKGFSIMLTLVGKHSRYSKWILKRESKSIKAGWLKVVGPVQREALPHYYSAADISCFPSWFETIGLVCLEAMASGSIVIGSSNSGMAEVIRDGIDGFLVEPKKPEILAECIKKVIELPLERKRVIKEEAKKRILENYDNSVIIPRMLDFYIKTIARHKQSVSHS